VPEARFDVVICGGGPAGASLGLRLARAGARVAIVEARRFPRFKACGEFMGQESVPILRELGVEEEVVALGAREVRGMVLHGHGRRAAGRFVEVGRARSACGHGWAVRREVLDDVLLRAAKREGVEVLEATRAVSLLRRGGIVEGVVARAHDRGETRRGEVRLRARWTIGADGVRSRIAGELGVRREVPWLRKLGLVTRYDGVDWGDQAEVWYLDGGYFACARVDGGLVSVNLVVELARFEGEGLRSEEFFEAHLARVPELAARLARGERVEPIRGTGPLAARTSEQVFDGAALVGDACGFVDPMTGEGLYFALRGAEALADGLIEAVRAGRADAGALSGYREVRRRELRPRDSLGFLLQRGMRSRTLLRGALALMEARPRLADVLMSLSGDHLALREVARAALAPARAVAGAVTPPRRT
jgi:flavin-dependent dehydrogenase